MPLVDGLGDQAGVGGPETTEKLHAERCHHSAIEVEGKFEVEFKDARNIADLIKIVKEEEKGAFESDERITKEMFQKTQLIDLLILVLIVLSNTLSLTTRHCFEHS